MRPWCAVEPFHHAAIFEVGVVVDGHKWHIAAFAHRALHNLAQCLEAIECAASIVAENFHSVFVYSHSVGARCSLHSTFHSLFGIEVHFEFSAVGCKFHPLAGKHRLLLAEAFFLIHKFVAASHIERAIGFNYLMWCGVDNQSLMVDFLARDSQNVLLLTALRT